MTEVANDATDPGSLPLFLALEAQRTQQAQLAPSALRLASVQPDPDGLPRFASVGARHSRPRIWPACRRKALTPQPPSPNTGRGGEMADLCSVA